MENVIVAKTAEESSTIASALAPDDDSKSKIVGRQLKWPVRSQRDAPQDLDLVSWPPRKRLPVFGKMPYFVYDIYEGVDTYIYIIDNGINKDNAVRNPSLNHPLHPFPDTALGIQIHAVAASVSRVALRLWCIQKHDG